jgi:phosphoribosylamine--glycine ligase
LAAGKGVLICDTPDEAEAALKQIMQERAFGSAGDRVVVEKRLTGREISILAFCDGKIVVPMIAARDHKRALDGDKGLNTGGMGAFAPATDIPQSLIDEIVETVLQPTLDGMAARGTPYTGILYAGLMLADDGPQVLEFNCRFGDPETQVILPLLQTDLFTIINACIEGNLDTIDLRWHDQTCATVVAASPGYPDSYPKGLAIAGLDDLQQYDDIVIFHAGTAIQDEQIVTSGGRVLAVSAVGNNLTHSLERAYAGMEAIHFDGMHFRRDIGRTQTEGAG